MSTLQDSATLDKHLKRPNRLGEGVIQNDRLEAYRDMVNMNSVVAVYANLAVRPARTQRNGESQNPPSSPTSLLDQGRRADAIFQVMTGPLAGYFVITGNISGNIEEKITLKALTESGTSRLGVELTDYLHGGGGNAALNALTEELRAKTLRARHDKSLNLPSVQQCLLINSLKVNNVIGSSPPEDEGFIEYQPVTKVVFINIALRSWEGVPLIDNPQAESELLVDCVTRYHAWEAELNLEAYRRNKNSFREMIAEQTEEQLDQLQAEFDPDEPGVNIVRSI